MIRELTIPLWFDNYILDRTIGLQFLIAKSQEIFGRNIFWAYLPTTIAAIIMLFITFKLHEELIDKKYAFVSPLILQLLIYGLIILTWLLKILFFHVSNYWYFLTSKNKKPGNNLFILLFGIWIGLAL